MKERKKERKKLKLFYVPSAIAAMVLLSTPTIAQLLLFIILGFLWGLIVYWIKPRLFLPKNILVKTCSLIIIACVSISVSISASQIFCRTWAPSSLLSAILSFIFSSADTGLIILSYSIGALALPFFAFLTFRAISWLVFLISLLNPRSLLEEAASRFSIPSFLKHFLCISANLFLAVALGTSALYAVYSLPLDRIKENVHSSASIINQEGFYPALYSWATSQLDNWTDSVMLLEAGDETNDTTMSRAMKVYRNEVDGFQSAESLIAHYIDGKDFTKSQEYTRYWHGYHVYLKPLLLFMDYQSIRILNLILQLSGILLTCILLMRNKLTEYILPFILSYLMLMPTAIANSLQYSSCFYTILLGIITLLLLNSKSALRYTSFVFLNIGIFTAFFDFLTYPIATFGVPVVFYLALKSSDSLERKIVDLIRNGIFWCIGFGGMWVSKWIIAYITTGYDFVGDAFEQVSFRMSGSVENLSTSLSSVGINNYSTFLSTPATLLIVVFSARMTIQICKTANSSTLEIGYTLLPYTLVSFAPLVWYAFATNHSAIHCNFTNKACVVTIVAFLFALIDIHNQSSSSTSTDKSSII